MVSAIKQAIKPIALIVLTVLLVGMMGCIPTPEPAPQEEPQANVEAEKEDTKKDEKEDEDDVIVAGTIDTSSQYSFSVEGAFVGVDEYSDVPEVILVCEFTNNSEETISFSSALEAIAFQSGHELSSAYLRGASSYNYDSIAPGKTTPVLIAWELISADDKVEITVIDRYHYAKEEIFNGSYTIDELIENSQKFIEEYDNIIDEGQELSV